MKIAAERIQKGALKSNGALKLFKMLPYPIVVETATGAGIGGLASCQTTKTNRKGGS